MAKRISRYISTAEAQQILGIKRCHMCRLIRDGVIDAIDVSSPGSVRAKWSVCQDSLNRFIEARRQRSPRAMRELVTK